MTFSAILEKILNRQDLTQEEASQLMKDTIGGNLSPIKIAAWLAAMRTKGETAIEIAAFVESMREQALKLPTQLPHLMDTCGTGGDRAHLINISTLTALSLASLGVPVAKHGNRAVSSASGSADLLEQLGYPLSETPEQSAQRLEKTNFCFLFAPTYHPAMKHAAPVRKELGVRTVFNLLGPLANPAKISLQLLGVYDRNWLAILAQALQQLGVKRALVVHGSGLDEIHPTLPTEYYEIAGPKIQSGLIEPQKLNLPLVDLATLRVSDTTDALNKAKAVLAGTFLEGVVMVALNTTAALYLYHRELQKTSEPLLTYLQNNYPSIEDHIRSGKVGQWLKQSLS